ncbi:hypothetical protein [Nocardiopsis dassonvillei]|uniref:hypothetical protein n=1 Tax=Nocardiopsis dassonvillei TaxID=2014 RepID=UPI003670C55D
MALKALRNGYGLRHHGPNDHLAHGPRQCARDRATARSPSGGRGPLRRRLRRRLDPIQPNSAKELKLIEIIEIIIPAISGLIGVATGAFIQSKSDRSILKEQFSNERREKDLAKREEVYLGALKVADDLDKSTRRTREAKEAKALAEREQSSENPNTSALIEAITEARDASEEAVDVSEKLYETSILLAIYGSDSVGPAVRSLINAIENNNEEEASNARFELIARIKNEIRSPE